MHFSQAVAIIQSQVGTIKGVQVLYNDSVSCGKLWNLNEGSDDFLNFRTR